MMKQTFYVEDVKVEFDGKYYRVFKEEQMKGFAQTKDEAIQMARHYVERRQS